MVNSKGKKVTIATIKSFIKREMAIGNLYIKNESTFDGMVDGVRDCDDKGFRKANANARNDLQNNTLGVAGAWFVGQSRDCFGPYADDNYIGYEVFNCCGSFVIAMGKYGRATRADSIVSSMVDNLNQNVTV